MRGQASADSDADVTASRAVRAAEEPAATDSGGLRIGDAAARAGLSTRTLRYYEELGLLSPSGHTAGGERRYRAPDLERLARIVELRDVLGMNLDDIGEFLETESRLDELRRAYAAKRDGADPEVTDERRRMLEEILSLNESLAEQLTAKLERMEAFRSTLLESARRCRELLSDH